MNSTSWLLIAALLLLVLLSAFFSAAETAYSAANRNRLKAMADDRVRGANRALRLLDDYESLLTSILVGNNVVNITATAIATVMFTRFAGDNGATISTVVMTVVVLIFGEVGPKTLAKKRPERFSTSIAGIMSALVFMTRPIDLLFSALRNLLNRFFQHDDE